MEMDILCYRTLTICKISRSEIGRFRNVYLFRSEAKFHLVEGNEDPSVEHIYLEILTMNPEKATLIAS